MNYRQASMARNENKKKAVVYFALAFVLYLVSGVATFGGSNFALLFVSIAVVFLAMGVYQITKGQLIRLKK